MTIENWWFLHLDAKEMNKVLNAYIKEQSILSLFSNQGMHIFFETEKNYQYKMNISQCRSV